MNKNKLLILDDEVGILTAVKRLFRREYDVVTFTEGEAALAYLAEHKTAVIISDMRMPGMDGAEFLANSVTISPNSIRILMTGFADMDSAVKAINQGKIFNYVQKPWDNQQLKLLVKNAFEHHNIIQQKQQLTKDLIKSNNEIKSLNESLELKVKQRTQQLKLEKDKLELANNQTKKFYKSMVTLLSGISSKTLQQHTGHSNRVANHAQAVAAKTRLPRNQIVSIYLAGLFHELGKLNIDLRLSKTPFYSLNHAEQKKYLNYCETSSNMLSAFEPLKSCADIIRRIQTLPNNEQTPPSYGSKLLKIIIDYDALLLGQILPRRFTPSSAQEWILNNERNYYDLSIAKQYFSWLNEIESHMNPDVDYLLSVNNVLSLLSTSDDTEVVLINNVENDKGKVYLTKETKLAESHLVNLLQIEKNLSQSFILNVAIQENKN